MMIRFSEVLASVLLTAALAVARAAVATDDSPEARRIGRLADGSELFVVRSGDDHRPSWGIEIRDAGRPLLSQSAPARIDWTAAAPSDSVVRLTAGYESITRTRNGVVGHATLRLPEGGAVFRFEDRWTIRREVLDLDRTVRVEGSAEAGGSFTSGLAFEMVRPQQTPASAAVRYFIPSAIYGAPVGKGPYGDGSLEIRENAMAAPLLGLYLGSGEPSAALLDRKPRADMPEQPRLGAMASRETIGGGIEFGCWFPGVRGGFLPSASSVQPSPGAANHAAGLPIRDGQALEYHLSLRLARGETFHAFCRNTWRWSWKTLAPPVYPQDIELVRRSLIDLLGDQVDHVHGRAGIPNFINWTLPPAHRPPDWKATLYRSRGAILGFTGKNLEAAVLLLMDAERGRSPHDADHRRKALAIIGSFLTLKMDPPEGEGFNIDTGHIEQAIPLDRGFPPQLYLRSFGDDLKILLLGYEFERRHGREHPEWLHWCQRFADWLLTQQQADGGFPRSWVPATGAVRVAAPQSSYNAVPLLVYLSRITGDPKYLRVAERAAAFVWDRFQAEEHFVGGTIDNPNVQDKEAATLSTEAYLALYEATKERLWLDRACAAADNAETYILLWEPSAGVPSVGVNKVTASFGSGGDMYMAFDVDEYAKLYRYTGDPHYRDVARLLLHNTKTIVALPGRLFDYPGPGWQTEAAIYPVPGRPANGTNNLWLPWVATSQLNGILFTEQFDEPLFRQLARK